MNEPRKVYEAEIVGREETPEEPEGERKVVEHVEVTRIPGGSFFTRSVHTGGDTEELKRSVGRLKLRLWIWFLSFLAVTAGCFWVAYVSEVFFFQVLLILTGGLTGLATGFLALLLWGIYRFRLPG